ncbi:TonB-dependent receptor [uncultured Alistipes sp.]|uniref:TonB-dependent receptor n=1 Tax=uncultured Alistipes sp. TaxID=538949 RepID=UPI0025DA7C67|nr:TonB-dependent receptor [uncultured Alistipes sp.]
MCSVVPAVVWAQRYDISGRVLIAGTENPVAQAVVELPQTGLWAVADSKGNFTIKGVPGGNTRFVVSSLGYETTVTEINIRSNTSAIRLYAPEDNLKLESVVVTAKEKTNAMSTSRTIGGNAINHLQMVNASDISSLLPGGKTVNPNLLDDNFFSLRSGDPKMGTAPKMGNAEFGTAVEVDGVRLSTNASLDDMSGASTRNISSTNIESVEVVTGVPSAEYGDLSSGVVKITTRKGKTPYMLTLSTNPRTKQVAASKGFDLGKSRGVLNSNVEYTRATKNPSSPYTAYSRTGISLNYQNTFVRVLRFNFGVTGNIGGMDTKDDPDAQMGEWEKARDNALRANTSLKWLLNKSWITSVDFDASLNYADKLARKHSYASSATQSPAVHAIEEGYYEAELLPTTYYTTRYVDSKQLDYAANLKALWVRHWGEIHSSAKVGVAWRADGNVGKGEYYKDPALSPNGYRPRPYTDIPYMHNLAVYVEELLTLPVGGMSLQVMAGLRAEKTFIENSQYKNTATLSPRLNLKLRINDHLTVRGGWGITEKLPSFNVLYPLPSYQDTRVFGTTYGNNRNYYVYHSQPYQVLYNDNLKWQRNRNSEVGMDLRFGGTEISLVGYFNRTKYPYKIYSQYDPFSYKVSTVPETLPDGSSYLLPSNPVFRVDKQSGEIFVRDADDANSGWVAMNTAVRETFMRNTYQGNSSPVDRMGLEFVVAFPQINPIRTQLRLDGSYNYTKYVNEGETCYYPASTSLGSFYPYVGIYPDTGAGTTVTYNGAKTHALDANLTATTHLPSIRMIISLRLEASLYKRSQNLSEYKGREYAFNVTEDRVPTGGSIYDGDSYTAVWPIAYIDLNGDRHPFTDAEKNDPAFASLLRRSGNAYSYNEDGWDPYFSANLSITKEIGDHVSVSFYANNFTNSRRFLKYYATGVRQVFTPDFYYGLTVRIKF